MKVKFLIQLKFKKQTNLKKLNIMKNILSILVVVALLATTQIFAQSPQKFNYQGVARNNSGQPLASQALGLRISIHDATPTGTVVYQETQSTTTNQFGLYALSIGGGTVVSGTMAGINWAQGDKFIQIEMDPAGGTSYTDLGTTQLLSVPYAQHSQQSSTIMMFGSGVSNPDKTIIAHSPAYMNYGLQYKDAQDQFHFISNGTSVMNVDLGSQRVGINTGTASPGATLEVNGTVKIAGGSPGAGKILTSDATGVANWTDQSTKVSTFQPTGCPSLNSVTTSYQKVGNIGTFNKTYSTTMVELTLQNNFYMGTFTGATGVVFELRIDDAATTNGNATLLIRSTHAGESLPGVITGIFSGLSSGSHTVSVWAKTVYGSGSSAMIDAGCFNSFGTNNVIVKEFQ